MFFKWVLTVSGEICKILPVSLFVFASATSLKISIWRLVSCVFMEVTLAVLYKDCNSVAKYFYDLGQKSCSGSFDYGVWERFTALVSGRE